MFFPLMDAPFSYATVSSRWNDEYYLWIALLYYIVGWLYS